MYTLFYSPGVCSKAVHIALYETKAEYKAICVNLHAPQKNEELLAVNPRHQVPVLKDGDLVIREGAAILTYLLEKEKSPLLPSNNWSAKAHALEWLAWANSTLHPAYGSVFMAPRVSADANIQNSITGFAAQRIQNLLNEADAHLAKNTFLAGDECTIADILTTVILQWKPEALANLKIGDNLARMAKAVQARPSWQAVTEYENNAAKKQAA